MILIAALSVAVLTLADGDPLAPGRDGLSQCYAPDSQRKVCRALGHYDFNPDGTITNRAEAMLNTDPLIVMLARSEVYIRDDAECARADLDGSGITAVTVDGEALEGVALDQVRASIVQAMTEAMGGDEVCSTYHDKGEGRLRAIVTVDGVSRPELSDDVIWVRESDGWTVGP